MNENESLTVTLTLENNEELECAVLNIFEADEKEYIALLPLDENGDNTDGQIYLYRFIDNGEEEEPGLENIEEERRLFYVAMTRAKDFLKICYVKIKNGKEVAPSRFVDELLKS